MKIISIIWDVLKLLFGGMDYDMAVAQVSMQHNVSKQMIYMNLEQRGYYREDYIKPHIIIHSR